VNYHSGLSLLADILYLGQLGQITIPNPEKRFNLELGYNLIINS